MATRRLYLVVFVLTISLQQVCVGEDEPALPADANAVSTEAKSDEQLDIIVNALFKDPNEQIRIKAATVMLSHESPRAREELLAALDQTGNSAARTAVCKALIQTRSLNTSLKNKEDFVGPLLGILSTEIVADAQLAAETTLIFEYEEIGERLEQMATDAASSITTRLNAIHALKLRSDMMATIRLIMLVDDPDPQVATQAEKALVSQGIPPGPDPETRKEIINDIRLRGQVAYLRTRLNRQEAQISQMRTQLDLWQKRYLSELDRRYKSIEDPVKGEFLARHLQDTETAVRSWALDKAYDARVAVGPQLPQELGPILINLISDHDRDIRLKTARLLALMVELDSAQHLLAQLEAEQDDQVKTGLFVALGQACYYALRPRSPAEVSPEVLEIREQTLGWAAKFLSEKDADKARNGAEVIKKLLERDGLQQEEVDRYLGLLADRYDQQKDEPGGALRGALLSAMAGLCAQDSTCRAKAAERFEPLFQEALRDKTDFVRETAVAGLVNIDKTSTLRTLIRLDFANDPSDKLRQKLIELADEVGIEEDLNWLVEKTGVNSEGVPAWQAMLKIFKESDASVLNAWVDRLTSENSKARLSDQQRIDFLKIAEAKAGIENKQEIRRRLADFYRKTAQFERAAEQLHRLYEAAQTPEQEEAILPVLLDAYLRGSKPEPAAELVKNRLSQGDLDPNDAVFRSVNDYLSERPAGTDPNTVYQVLAAIEPPQPRPKWNKWLEEWALRLEKREAIEKPEEAIEPEEE